MNNCAVFKGETFHTTRNGGRWQPWKEPPIQSNKILLLNGFDFRELTARIAAFDEVHTSQNVVYASASLLNNRRFFMFGPAKMV